MGVVDVGCGMWVPGPTKAHISLIYQHMGLCS